MHVSLTPELEKMVKSQVETGRYNSSSELVREALRLWMDEQTYKEKLSVLRAEVRKGFESGDAKEFDAKSFLSEMKEKHLSD